MSDVNRKKALVTVHRGELAKVSRRCSHQKGMIYTLPAIII